MMEIYFENSKSTSFILLQKYIISNLKKLSTAQDNIRLSLHSFYMLCKLTMATTKWYVSRLA